MTGSSVKLSVRNAVKTYGAVVALADASLELREGEFLTLLGPSGSGKTTLLMMVAGLIQPTSGEIWIDGKLATYLPPHKRDIGIVFQNYALFPHLTVYENIAFPLRMRGRDDRQIRADVQRALDTVQLSHTAGRLPRELSGGQQQRIALARCTVYQPSIILMDEPLGALDRKLRDQMQLEIKHLQKRLGITMLYVTHDQDEAMTMSDRICLMNNGRIEQIGTPQELYFLPRSKFAAEFVGDSNILPVRVTSRAGARVFNVTGPGDAPLQVCFDGDCPPDTQAMALVRPESIRLSEPSDHATNSVEGILREVIFVGATCRFSVELPGKVLVWGKQLAFRPDLVARIGSSVHISWNPEATVLIKIDPRPAT